MYSSTLSLPSALDGGGWSTPRPGRFNPRKTRYVLYRVGPRAGLDVWKISPPPAFDPRTVQPVTSHSLQLRSEATNVTTVFLVATFTLVTEISTVSAVIILVTMVTLVNMVTSGLTITMVTETRRKFLAQRTCSDF